MKQAYKDFIQQKISKETFENKKASFLGVLSHGRNRKLSRRIKNMI
jgi:hypothetical protein